MYLLISGRINCLTKGSVCIKSFIAGSYFGDVELLLNLPRMFATKVQETAKLIMIPGQSIKHLQFQNQRFYMQFLKRTVKRHIGINIAKKRCEIFANITHKDDFWNVIQAAKPISTQVNAWLEDFHWAQKEINDQREYQQDDDDNISVLMYKIKRSSPTKNSPGSPTNAHRRKNQTRKRQAVNFGMQRLATLVIFSLILGHGNDAIGVWVPQQRCVLR